MYQTIPTYPKGSAENEEVEHVGLFGGYLMKYGAAAGGLSLMILVAYSTTAPTHKILISAKTTSNLATTSVTTASAVFGYSSQSEEAKAGLFEDFIFTYNRKVMQRTPSTTGSS